MLQFEYTQMDDSCMGYPKRRHKKTITRLIKPCNEQAKCTKYKIHMYKYSHSCPRLCFRVPSTMHGMKIIHFCWPCVFCIFSSLSMYNSIICDTECTCFLFCFIQVIIGYRHPKESPIPDKQTHTFLFFSLSPSLPDAKSQPKNSLHYVCSSFQTRPVMLNANQRNISTVFIFFSISLSLSLMFAI